MVFVPLWYVREGGLQRSRATIAPIAQLVEHLPFKQEVRGSSPRGRTTPLNRGRFIEPASVFYKIDQTNDIWYNI